MDANIADVRSRVRVFNVEDYGATGNGTTDDRLALQNALNAAETAAAAANSKCIVQCGRGKTYKIVSIAYAPTSGTTGYGGLAIPSKVIFDLNGSVLRFVSTSVGTEDGAWIFPKGLPTNTTDYGAASDWEVRNGRLETSSRTVLTGVSGTASTDVLTSAAHGLTNGTRVSIRFSSGFAGLTSSSSYYVVSATTDTFKLSATSGGSAIDITTDGTNASVHTTDTRVGNALVFSQCKNVIWRNLTISQRFYHAFEIQAGDNLLVEDVTIEPGNLIANAAPDIQFDPTGNAGVSTNSGFTHKAEISNIVMRRVRMVGFHPADNTLARRIEFGHSAGIARKIVFDECYFDGIKGSELASSTTSYHILDVNTAAFTIEDLVIRNSVFNHDAISGLSSCLSFYTGANGKYAGILVEGCKFTGVYVCAVDFGGFNTGSPAATNPENRRNLVARNCVAQLGHEDTLGTLNYRARNSTAAQTSGGTATVFTASRCESVTFDNCLAIMPTTWTNMDLTTRIYYGFYVTNNTSTTIRDCHTRWTHTLGASVPAAGYFYSGRANVDGVINTDSRQCKFVVDGFTVDAIGGSAAYRYCWKEDAITAAAAERLSGYRAGIIFKQAGSSAGNENEFYFALGADKTITAAGTTGARTIHKQAGSVNFAAAATSVVVTNTICTTASHITGTVATNDATMKSVQIVAGSGSFTIYANAAATGETRVNWIIN